MPTATQLGQAGLQGWREKLADGVAEPVADRVPLEEDQVRAAIGALFFVLSVIYVVQTVKAADAPYLSVSGRSSWAGASRVPPCCVRPPA